MSTDVIPAHDIEQALITMGDIDLSTSEDVQQDIVRRILAAETIEQAARSFTATPAEQVEGVPLEVHGIAWLKSTFPDGPPIYCLVDCLPEHAKDRVTVSIGGRSVMAFLRWCELHKAMPFRCVFVRSDPSPSTGYRYWTVKLASGKAKS